MSMTTDAFNPWDDNPWDDVPVTRDKSHPDGFSFLRASDSAFWKTWLAFTSKEIEMLRWVKWRYEQDGLGEFDVPADPES